MKASGKNTAEGFMAESSFEADTFNIKDDTPTFKCRDKQATCTDNELELRMHYSVHTQRAAIWCTESVHTDSVHHHRGLKEKIPPLDCLETSLPAILPSDKLK